MNDRVRAWYDSDTEKSCWACCWRKVKWRKGKWRKDRSEIYVVCNRRPYDEITHPDESSCGNWRQIKNIDVQKQLFESLNE